MKLLKKNFFVKFLITLQLDLLAFNFALKLGEVSIKVEFVYTFWNVI